MQMRTLSRGKNIRSAGYDAVTGTLRVAFGKSGEYDYAAVPEEKFVSLCRVPFPDRYYTQAIKGKFDCVKVVDPPEELNAGNDDRKAAAEDRGEHGRAGEHRSADVYPRSTTRDARSVLLAGRDSGTTGATQRDGNESGRLMEVFYPQDGVTFTEADHSYYLKGVRVPFSLTQILELSGISRKPSSAQEIAARPAAAKRGTKVHEATFLMDQDDFDVDSLKPWPEYYNRCIGWQQFREDFKFFPDLTMCEAPIAVRVNGCLYAMKLDRYGAIGEGDNTAMAVVEIKTTAQEEDSHAIQTAGQAIAFKSHAESLKMPLKRYCVYLFDKLNAANCYYSAVEHTDRNDEKIFVGAALANVYYRSQHGLLEK